MKISYLKSRQSKFEETKKLASTTQLKIVSVKKWHVLTPSGGCIL